MSLQDVFSVVIISQRGWTGMQDLGIQRSRDLAQFWWGSGCIQYLGDAVADSGRSTQILAWLMLVVQVWCAQRENQGGFKEPDLRYDFWHRFWTDGSTPGSRTLLDILWAKEQSKNPTETIGLDLHFYTHIGSLV